MNPHAVVLRGGEVMLLSHAVRSLLVAVLDEAVRVHGYTSPLVNEVRNLLVVAEQRSRSAAEHGGIPLEDEPPELASDLIDTTEAGQLLRTTSRAVRARCERGSFETARRVAGGPWRIERAEVLAVMLERKAS